MIPSKRHFIVSSSIDVIEDGARKAPPGELSKVLKIVARLKRHFSSPFVRVSSATLALQSKMPFQEIRFEHSAMGPDGIIRALRLIMNWRRNRR